MRYQIYSVSLYVPTHFVEVEYQIQLTHVPKERIQYLHEEVYSLKISQFVIICIDAGAEEKARVSAVYNLGHVAELDEVGLVFLVAWCYEAVDLYQCSIYEPKSFLLYGRVCSDRCMGARGSIAMCDFGVGFGIPRP
jgi:hypothetical protein